MPQCGTCKHRPARKDNNICPKSGKQQMPWHDAPINCYSPLQREEIAGRLLDDLEDGIRSGEMPEFAKNHKVSPEQVRKHNRYRVAEGVVEKLTKIQKRTLLDLESGWRLITIMGEFHGNPELQAWSIPPRGSNAERWRVNMLTIRALESRGLIKIIRDKSEHVKEYGITETGEAYV